MIKLIKKFIDQIKKFISKIKDGINGVAHLPAKQRYKYYGLSVLRFVTRRPWHQYKAGDRVNVRTRHKKGPATIIALDKFDPEYLVVLDADREREVGMARQVFDFWVKESNIKSL